jgi:hypothetical protein
MIGILAWVKGILYQGRDDWIFEAKYSFECVNGAWKENDNSLDHVEEARVLQN